MKTGVTDTGSRIWPSRPWTVWPWHADTATVTDAFGQVQTVQGRDGQIRLPVSVTPVFITEQSPGAAS